MDYKNIYKAIVKKDNKDSLIDLFKETGNWEKLEALKLEIITNDNLPYTLVTVDSRAKHLGYFSSAMIGVYLDNELIMKFTEDYKEDYFYLPIIIKPKNVHPAGKDIITEKNSIQHELIHISDILDWIDEEPDYIERSLMYNLESAIESATEKAFKKSIFLEIEKLFRLEPRAMAHDYDNGEDFVIQPLLNDIFIKYNCSTKEEYIQIKIADYITILKTNYCENFSNKEDFIENCFKKSIKKYGKDIFGEKPNKMIIKVNKHKDNQLLKEALKMVKVNSIKIHQN